MLTRFSRFRNDLSLFVFSWGIRVRGHVLERHPSLPNRPFQTSVKRTDDTARIAASILEFDVHARVHKRFVSLVFKNMCQLHRTPSRARL